MDPLGLRAAERAIDVTTMMTRIAPCRGAAHGLLAQDFDKLLRSRHADLPVVREREEILVSHHQRGNGSPSMTRLGLAI